ncbi:uncharacterized protein [Primulina huaijiensis]|uniref:uncharacterized protein isoform X1 n=1 Tax=Primulina huaijiensis TaxID=1492673 RepID=UPI003CC6F9F3
MTFSLRFRCEELALDSKFLLESRFNRDCCLVEKTTPVFCVSYHEAEQLGLKLLVTSLELEKLKAEAKEEVRKNNELKYLLNFALKERDEAKNQLQNLLNTTEKNIPSFPHFHVDSPVKKPAAKANSSVTESNSLSETYNYHSHGSSPVDCLFDSIPSPEFSNINFVVSNHPLVQEPNVTISNSRVTSEVMPRFDEGSFAIDNLVRGRPLPQQGKFLQAVLDAGPLLHTLFMAGPLPRWRNPPQLHPAHIPPVSIKGCDTDIFAQKPPPNSARLPQRLLNLQPYAQMSCGSSQVFSAPMLNFANLASGSCLSNGSPMPSGLNASACVPFGKRQRLY